MLASRNRFHGHGSLRYIYMNGRSIRTRLFTLKYVENKRRKTPRVSVVVSKKVYKGAVGRNRIRRRIYEIIRRQLPFIISTTDIVVIISSNEVRLMPAPELEKMVVDSLTQAGLLKDVL